MIAAIIMLASCNNKKKDQANDNSNTNVELEIKVFSNDSTVDSAIGGFGYNIYVSKVLYVHQPNIPAVNGNRGFNSIADAEKTGGLSAYKIRNNIMPPSISIHELDSLEIFGVPKVADRKPAQDQELILGMQKNLLYGILAGVAIIVLVFIVKVKRKQ